MAGGFQVDMTQLSRELKDMKDYKFATLLRKNIRTAVAESGQVILDAVKRNASWSTGSTSSEDHPKRPHTSIPAATKLSFAFSTKSAGAVIRVSSKKAPHGRPMEMGSQHARAGQNRHPLFGNTKKMISQPTRPFFFTAVDQKTEAARARIIAAVDRVVAESGYKGI